MTDNNAIAGWVFYDAECDFCLRSVARWGRLFARRGFVWKPLQSPGAAAQLRVTEAELYAELKLLRPDSRVLGGIDAWTTLMRSVWWLWPLGALLTLPGLHAAGAWTYRWVARHRHCLGGACRLQTHPSHRHTTFFELP